ncbi:phytanoyl-CoA dioxygenase family protein [Micromonospora sp. NPDC049051]|uniref:phytanoyl-CoA dioxygenase family protein n=1 Tax=Micromonospora sp. NPDC049051 TaxID=3364264 RepID=UPI00371B9013
MNLSPAQLTHYEEHGYLVLGGMFTATEIATLRKHARHDLDTDSPRRVHEAGSGLVRATHGAHLVTPFFHDLVRMPRLVGLAEQVVGPDVYVHQFKINAKAALGGEVWQWHQDSYFWRHEDGLRERSAVNILIHLDEVDEFNGPLLLIPGSHRYGDLPAEEIDEVPEGEGWRTTVSARLKYTVDTESLRSLVDKQGIVSVKGPAGTVLLFDPAVVHGSSNNLSPYDRCLLILSYNSSHHPLAEVPRPRPEFLASRNPVPLRPLEHDDLPQHPVDGPTLVGQHAVAVRGIAR